MADVEIIDLRSDSSESEQESSSGKAARKRLRRPASQKAGRGAAEGLRPQSKRVKKPLLREQQDSESEQDGSDENGADGEQEEEEDDFLTDDVESSSGEEEEPSSIRRRKAAKAAPKGRKQRGKPPPARAKGKVALSDDDDEEELGMMTSSSMSQESSTSGGKMIGLKRKRSGGKEGGASANERAAGPSSILSFVRKESGSIRPPPVSTKPTEDKLWTDKYRPKRTVDLTVPPKKVEEVRKWLLDAMTGGRGAQKLLILRGAPGVGKSTMLEMLAKELNLKIISWAEVTGGGAWKGREEGESWSGGRDYVSQAEDFQSFLRGSAFQPLEIDAKAPPTGAKGRRITFEDDDGGASESRQLVVLEELPTQGTSDRGAGKLGAALSYFLAESRHPGVIVLTDENEDKGSLEYEKRLPREVLQSPFVSQIRINPATDANLRKVLTRIASNERVSLSADDLSAIIMSCRGDVRHAILTLQLHLAPLKKAKGSKSPRGSGAISGMQPPSASSDKDTYYSSFHAIGKLLYAKRDSSAPGPGSGDGRPPLAFVPETVMERCDMEVDAISTFVQAHCLLHFSELAELTDCLALLSDADLYISRIFNTQFHRDQRDPIFPEAYCSSIVGRAVAHTNLHPAKAGSYAKLTSPPWYECARLRRERLERLGHLCNDYALDMAANRVPPVRLSSESMVQDLVPFAKAIAAYSSPTGSSQLSQSSFSSSQRSTGEDEVESLTSALSFVRLFNRRLSTVGQHRSTQHNGHSSQTGPPAHELAEDDIIDDDA